MATLSQLRTRRLVLEPLKKRHAAKVIAQFLDPRIYEFFPFDPPASLERLEERFANLEPGISPDGKEVWLNWLMRLKTAEVFVGHLQATVAGEQALIAYTVFPSHWRKGYAIEGCREMIRHVFEDYDVKQIAALMDTRNAASIALVESLGLKRVGMTPGADTIRGMTSDEFRYEMTRAKWGRKR